MLLFFFFFFLEGQSVWTVTINTPVITLKVAGNCRFNSSWRWDTPVITVKVVGNCCFNRSFWSALASQFRSVQNSMERGFASGCLLCCELWWDRSSRSTQRCPCTTPRKARSGQAGQQRTSRTTADKQDSSGQKTVSCPLQPFVRETSDGSKDLSRNDVSGECCHDVMTLGPLSLDLLPSAVLPTPPQKQTPTQKPNNTASSRPNWR